MKRRDLLKTLGLAAGTALMGKDLAAQETASGKADGDPWGLLIDTTKCRGCGMCERACKDKNGLGELEPPEGGNGAGSNGPRSTSPYQLTVVNQHETDAGTVSVKKQCMHCIEPACVSACLTKALYRTPQGAVAWDGDKCMGCRYCMVSCPFDMPKFEYDTPVPQLRKCQLCFDRQEEGEAPACASICPFGAIQAGRRSELLREARKRIALDADGYHDHIYGEHEAGGTSALYLASVPFDQLGFRTDLSREAYPTFTKEFLYAVPMVLTLLPPFLLGISRATRGREEGE
jgi:formate dehydrogenase iron-sulfur subunit